MMEWLNSNSAAISAMATAMLVIITGFYTWVTLGLLHENKEIRAGLSKPDIAVYVTVHEGYVNFLNLVVENVGSGAAYDVILNTENEFAPESKIDVRRLGFFRHTLGFFGSRQKIVHFLASMPESWDELMKEPLKIHAVYADSHGRTYEKRFAIDFAVFENLSRVGKQPLYSLADDLEKIRKDIGHISTGFHKIQVLTEPLEQYRRRGRAEGLYYLIRQLPEAEQGEITKELQERVKNRRS